MLAIPPSVFAVLLSLYLAVPFAPAVAQSYPLKPVRIITAGVGTFHDIVTRQLSQRLSEHWNQPVVVENQPAAGLTIGTSIAARATPDGHTLLMSDRSALAVAPTLYRKLAYDPGKDLAPITLVARAPLALVAHPSVPAANLREFIDYAKQRPGVINYACAGLGTAPHIAGEFLKYAAGIDIVCVQYKGGGAAVTAVVSGEASVVFSSIATLLQHVKTGKLKAYAIASRKRFAGAPDIPTADEAGLPGFESEQWIGMLAPVRTSAALIDRLNREIVDVVRSPAMQSTLLAQGAEPSAGTPQEFSAFIKNESVTLRKLIERTGMRAE
jgi:tripartite-type tricarboxylate transporter receptor subunit TctC